MYKVAETGEVPQNSARVNVLTNFHFHCWVEHNTDNMWEKEGEMQMSAKLIYMQSRQKELQMREKL